MMFTGLNAFKKPYLWYFLYAFKLSLRSFFTLVGMIMGWGGGMDRESYEGGTPVLLPLVNILIIIANQLITIQKIYTQKKPLLGHL